MPELKMTPIASRLRASILQRAVQGRLVPQDPSEGTADDLLARIREERRELVGRKRAKAPKGGESRIFRGPDGSWYERRGKGDPVCIDEEIPFDVPESWGWARLGDSCVLERGSGIKRNEVRNNGSPCVRYGELYTTYRTEIRSVSSHVDSKVFDDAHKLFPGEVLMTLTGENDIDIGRAVVNETDQVLAYGGDLAALKYHRQNGRYLMFLINSPYVGTLRTRQSTGNTIVHLSVKKIEGFLIPVPPLAEQERIVARIDELMPIVDRLEALEAENDALDDAFWRGLPKSILQRAVQGRLVPQDPSEGTADDLLARIREERRELVGRKRAKAPKGGESRIFRGPDGSWYERRGKGDPVCIDEEIPFDVPESWGWARLGSLISDIDAGKSPKCADRKKVDGEWGVIKTTAIQPGEFHPKENKVLPTGFSIPEQAVIHNGDVLITRAGPANRTGIACVVKQDVEWLILSDKTLRINYLRGFLTPEYLCSMIGSPFGKQRIVRAASGMASSQVNISQDNLRRLLAPVPPLAEQGRIAARVNELMGLLDCSVKRGIAGGVMPADDAD